MKVALLTHHWQPYTHHSEFSGYERIAYYIKEHCNIDVLTWKFIPFNYSDNLSVHRIFTPPTDIFLERRLIISLNALIKGKNYDIIHSLYPIPGLFPSFKYPVIVTIHTIYDINKNVWLLYYSNLQKIIIKRAKYVITVSSSLKHLLEKKYRKKEIIFIPHGIDTEYFKPIDTNKVNKNKIKKNMLKNTYSHISLTTGIYGTDFHFIEKLAMQFPNMMFIIVGKSNKSKFNNIKYMTNISNEQLKILYDISDIFIKPLKFATANNSILEAMSMGKLIITDSIPGIFDYLDEQCACLIQTRDDYPTVIRHILENKYEKQLKEKRVREKANREFSWDIIAKKTYEVYITVYNKYKKEKY